MRALHHQRRAVASAIEAALSTANIPEVVMISPTRTGVTHRWTNIRRLQRRGLDARIWAGFHYRFSVGVGQDIGRKIGEHVVKSRWQPVTTIGHTLIDRCAGLADASPAD